MGMLSSVGIYGWDRLEPTILSALATNQSPLLIGDHGCNKTEGTKSISQLLLGPDTIFKNYEVPVLNIDDMLGYPNPKKLSEGEFDWVDTPLSLWDANAVLFDELNRANPFVQGKLHEIIRTKRVLGQRTKIQHVWSAINPPNDKYDSSPMGLALASRFVCIEIPTAKSTLGYLDNILEGKVDGDSKNYSEMWSQVNQTVLQIKQIELVRHLMGQVVKLLLDNNINFSLRQAKSVYQMILASLKLEISGFYPQDIDNYVELVISMIPEAFGILMTSPVEMSSIRNGLITILGNIKYTDPVMIAKNIHELFGIWEEGKYEDNQMLIDSIQIMLNRMPLQELEQTIAFIPNSLRPVLKENVKQRWVTLKVTPDGARSYEWLRKLVETLINDFENGWEKLEK